MSDSPNVNKATASRPAKEESCSDCTIIDLQDMHGETDKGNAGKEAEIRSFVKVEVDVLGSPSLTVRTVSVDVEEHLTRYYS